MKIALISLFPEMFKAVTDYGVTGRAVSREVIKLKYFNPRDFTEDKHQTVDARPYGGGPGMVMLVEPLRLAVEAARVWLDESEQAPSEQEPSEAAKVIYLSPQGQQFCQGAAQNFASNNKLIFIAGRYEGIDERAVQSLVDEEWSIGDYVLSGGELPAMVVMDAVTRLLPGVLGDEQSAEQDSFVDGLLDCPHYTRPESYRGEKVPAVLMSGDHKKIRQWRLGQALRRTQIRRPDLLLNRVLSEEELQALKVVEAADK